MQVTTLKNCLSVFDFSPVSFFPSRRKFEPLTKVKHKFANTQIAFDFLSMQNY